MPRLRLAFEWLTIVIIAALAAVGVAYTSSGERLSNWLFDRELAWAEQPIDNRILIAQIDEQSLTAIGRWPWPRSVHARIIDRLSEAEVAAVGYDVLFTEPAAAADDAALAAALARSGRVAVPAYAEFPGSNGRSFDVVMPIEPIVQAARTIGHVNVLFDSDGLVRRARLQSATQPQRIPHLVQGVAGIAGQSKQAVPEIPVIPLRASGSYPAIPVEKILKGEVPPALLKGKIVLVGATAQGLGDILPVPAPAGSVMPGIEVQANLLNALLGGLWIRDAGPLAASAAAVGLLLLVMAFYWQASPNLGLSLTLAVAIAAVAASAGLLAQFRLWLSPMPLLAALLAAYPLWNWRRLSALNSFVARETRQLAAELGGPMTGTPQSGGLDTIANAASRLQRVIGELRDRRSFLSKVIEGAPDALAVVDSDGIVTVANERAQALFGPSAEGTNVQTLLARIAGSEVGDAEEISLTDGRTILIKSAQLGPQDEADAGTILRLADISERRNAEREREEMLEFLSHDMRAPQAGILTALDSAAGNPDMPIPVERIRSYAAKSLKLADDFVQLARLSALTPRREMVDPTGLLEEAIDGAYDAARRKQVKVELRAPDDLPLLETDHAMLLRAVANLLDNAIKYSPVGGAVNCTIASEARQDGSVAVLISIADTGPGIAPERLQSLFKRYGMTDGSAGLSAGLGLAFVKRAMDLLGGEIECVSGATGTTFTLRHPAIAHGDFGT